MSTTTSRATTPPALAPGPPGPAGLPLVGILPQFGRNPLGSLTRIARRHGDVARLPLGKHPTYLLSGPAEIERVHQQTGREFRKGYGEGPLLGNGLVTSEGEFWRRQRRLAQPAFHRERVDAYGATMVARAERLLAGWRDGERRDLHAEMTRLTLGVVAKTLFEAEVTGEADTVGRALTVALRESQREETRIIRLPARLPTPGRHRLRRAVADLHRIVAGIIARRQASGRDHGDLLSMLIAARDDDGAGMSDRQLRDEVMTLFLAGHETTANALSWTWLLLSRHPEVEAALLAELRAVLGGRAPALADLPRLRYTDATLREAMRLYPPVWLVSRQPLAEVELGGYRLPAGADLWMSPWVVQRDPRFFPDPKRFDPARWLGDQAPAPPRFAYFPFGSGPRKCIGAAFAEMEMALVLATIAQRFGARIDGPVAIEAATTIRPRHGLPATLSAR